MIVPSVLRASRIAAATSSGSPDIEHDIGSLDGDVGPGADGDPEIGGGQGGGIVDPVTDEGDGAALALDRSDLAELVGREHIGDDGVDAHLAGDGVGGPQVVTCDHPGSQTHLLQHPDRLRCRGPHRIGHRQRPSDLPVVATEKGGLALVLPPLIASSKRSGICRPRSAASLGLPATTSTPSTLPMTPRPGISSTSLASGTSSPRSSAPSATAMPIGWPLGQFHCRHPAQKHVGVLIGFDPDQGHRPGGEGSGLVEENGVDRPGPFEDLGILEEDAEFGSAAAPDHDGGGGGQTQRAGTSDYQDRHRRPNGFGEIAIDDHPGDKGRQGDEDHRPARRPPRFDRPTAAPGLCRPEPASTSRTIWNSAVSSPTLVARTAIRPC